MMQRWIIAVTAVLLMTVAVPAMAFDDTNGHVFEADIEWLDTSGVTRGCNPPTNTRFCPDQAVTRGQMAAFLVRALNLPAGTDTFDDTNGHLFERDIRALAAAGVTRGCNPPTNTRFCPDQAVTRGQMAAFLHRALGGGAAPADGAIYTRFGGFYRFAIDDLGRYLRAADIPEIDQNRTDLAVNTARGEYSYTDGTKVVFRHLHDQREKQVIEWPDGGRPYSKPLASPDGRYVAANVTYGSAAGGRLFEIVRRSDGEFVREFDRRGLITSHVWGDNSDLFVTIDHTVFDHPDVPGAYGIWRIPAGEIARPDGEMFPLPGTISEQHEPVLHDVAASGREILLSLDGALHVYDITTDKLRGITTGPSSHVGGKFSPDGTQVAFANYCCTSGPFGGHGTIHVVPNHRGAPIEIADFNGSTELTTANGEALRSHEILEWGG